MADLALWADIGDEVRKGVVQAKDLGSIYKF